MSQKRLRTFWYLCFHARLRIKRMKGTFEQRGELVEQKKAGNLQLLIRMANSFCCFAFTLSFFCFIITTELLYHRIVYFIVFSILCFWLSLERAAFQQMHRTYLTFPNLIFFLCCRPRHHHQVVKIFLFSLQKAPSSSSSSSSSSL